MNKIMNKIIKLVKEELKNQSNTEYLENIFFCFVKSKEKLTYLINYINIKPFKKLKKGEYSSFSDYLIEFGGIDDLALINYKIINPKNIKTGIELKGDYFYFNDTDKNKKENCYLVPFEFYNKTFKLLNNYLNAYNSPIKKNKEFYLDKKKIQLRQEQIELFLEPYKITSIYDYIFNTPQLLKARK